MKRIGIFGGTFNPVHKGHLGIAEGALRLFNLDLVYFVPTGDSYHKTQEYSPSREDRLAMLELAIGKEPRFQLSLVDVDRQGPTYTADTIKDFRKTEPEALLFLILGADAFVDIMNWKGIGEFANEVLFLVELRKGYSRTDIDVLTEAWPEYFEDRVFLFEWPIPNISSRDILKNRLNKKYLPREVYNYIKERGLYPHVSR